MGKIKNVPNHQPANQYQSIRNMLKCTDGFLGEQDFGIGFGIQFITIINLERGLPVLSSARKSRTRTSVQQCWVMGQYYSQDWRTTGVRFSNQFSGIFRGLVYLHHQERGYDHLSSYVPRASIDWEQT